MVPLCISINFLEFDPSWSPSVRFFQIISTAGSLSSVATSLPLKKRADGFSCRNTSRLEMTEGQSFSSHSNRDADAHFGLILHLFLWARSASAGQRVLCFGSASRCDGISFSGPSGSLCASLLTVVLLNVKADYQRELVLTSSRSGVWGCWFRFVSLCCPQVVQSDSEEADGFEGAGRRAELRRHRC